MNFQFPIFNLSRQLRHPAAAGQFRKLRRLVHLLIITCLVLATTTPIAAKTPTGVMAQKEGTASNAVVATEAAQMEATDAAKKKSDYQLPYPGLLPDHPLYILKTIRDRIIDFLIADPIKKAEFTLLAADKRLAAAAALVEKGKRELAESTASKGQVYLSRSLSEVKKAKSQGKEATVFVTKLKSALEKHEEVLRDIIEKTDGPVKDRFTAMLDELIKQRKSL